MVRILRLKIDDCGWATIMGDTAEDRAQGGWQGDRRWHYNRQPPGLEKKWDDSEKATMDKMMKRTERLENTIGSFEKSAQEFCDNAKMKEIEAKLVEATNKLENERYDNMLKELDMKTKDVSEKLQLMKDGLDAHNTQEMLEALDAKCRDMATHVADYGKAFPKDIVATKKELLKAIEENRTEILDMQMRNKQVDGWLQDMWDYICKCTSKGKTGKGGDARNITVMTKGDYDKL
eukprot:TRINITY_DN27920_c2_g1_i2.p1 TRINITY_DN27920_c2_g1~~TRINITY_DN27920_c2_g1_i2.p1  ORF type:complete len:234 (-),score=83.21 TRINITY_DN27920_c2_g1_i2:53-754(-)